jgi:hypothetical protein
MRLIGIWTHRTRPHPRKVVVLADLKLRLAARTPLDGEICPDSCELDNSDIGIVINELISII